MRYLVFSGGSATGLQLFESLNEVDLFVTDKIFHDHDIFLMVVKLEDEFKCFYAIRDKLIFVDIQGEIANVLFQIEHKKVLLNEIDFDESLLIPGA